MLETRLRESVSSFLVEQSLSPQLAGQVQMQETRKEYEGDITLVVFPLVKVLKKAPEEAGTMLGRHLKQNIPWISGFNVVKGFLNLTLSGEYWLEQLQKAVEPAKDGIAEQDKPVFMVEYSSPNTNKPLHLGHVRNNLIGFALSGILEHTGKKVVKTNIVNDRGIHICKTMLAWQKWANGATPATAGVKGDHFVGDLYVQFEQNLKKEIQALTAEGMNDEEARRQAPLIREARELLRKWEAGDPETIALWEQMNRWVYDGFDKTYKELGVSFDKIYYESETYKLGKELVMKALEKGWVYRRDDGSVWVDLKDEGLDEKLLLRADGTAVYMTQDLGTARIRYDDYKFDRHIYVVGNEQNYHFQVLKIVLRKLGFTWADRLYHLSYGMVELPEGKMKSREGTVVDADDLIAEMKETARETGQELGKLENLTGEEKEEVFRKVGLGALKYFILKVDPKKNMTFNPRESVDFNGNTGPFIQYTYARIQSVLRKAKDLGITVPEGLSQDYLPNAREVAVLRILTRFDKVVEDAAGQMNPAIIANFTYELVKAYNQFYHDYFILKEPDPAARDFRTLLTRKTGEIILEAMTLLGIELPDRM